MHYVMTAAQLPKHLEDAQDTGTMSSKPRQTLIRAIGR